MCVIIIEAQKNSPAIFEEKTKNYSNLDNERAEVNTVWKILIEMKQNKCWKLDNHEKQGVFDNQIKMQTQGTE